MQIALKKFDDAKSTFANIKNNLINDIDTWYLSQLLNIAKMGQQVGARELFIELREIYIEKKSVNSLVALARAQVESAETVEDAQETIEKLWEFRSELQYGIISFLSEICIGQYNHGDEEGSDYTLALLRDYVLEKSLNNYNLTMEYPIDLFFTLMETRVATKNMATLNFSPIKRMVIDSKIEKKDSKIIWLLSIAKKEARIGTMDAARESFSLAQKLRGLEDDHTYRCNRNQGIDFAKTQVVMKDVEEANITLLIEYALAVEIFREDCQAGYTTIYNDRCRYITEGQNKIVKAQLGKSDFVGAKKTASLMENKEDKLMAQIDIALASMKQLRERFPLLH